MTSTMTSVTTSPKEITLKSNDIISGYFGSYQIKQLRGEGTYARVAWCVDLSTNQNVAVKISRLKLSRATKHEAYVLQKLAHLSKNKNVVKFIKAFKYQDHYCLVLEHLDKTLFDYMFKRELKPLHISDIRYIAKQLLVTFKELAKHNLVHGDLKPDNIMLVNQKHEPFRVKLIDFGMSIRVSCMTPGITIQAVGYRAPEVILGTELNEAIDMWALGCVLAYLYQGEHLFPHKSEYESMRIITQIQGMPDLHLLREGRFTEKFFSWNSEMTGTNQYKLRPREEYTVITGKTATPCRNLSKSYMCLEDMMANHPPPQTEAEREDTRQFFNLLNKLLQVNPAERITAAKALQHPFITQKTPSMSVMQYLRSRTWSSTPLDDGDKLSSSSSDLSVTEPQLFQATSTTKLKPGKDRVPTSWVSNSKATDNSGKTSEATILNWKPNIDKGMDSGSRKIPIPSNKTSNFKMTNTESSAEMPKAKRTTSCWMSKDTASMNNQPTSMAKGKTAVGRIGTFFRKMFRKLTCTNVSGVDE